MPPEHGRDPWPRLGWTRPGVAGTLGAG